ATSDFLSGVPVIGGILGVAWRADPRYGLATGDWEGWARAYGTSVVIGAAVAATVASGGLIETHPMFYVILSGAIGFSSSASIARINGASNEDALKAGLVGGAISFGFAAANVGYVYSINSLHNEVWMRPSEAPEGLFGLSPHGRNYLSYSDAE